MIVLLLLLGKRVDLSLSGSVQLRRKIIKIKNSCNKQY